MMLWLLFSVIVAFGADNRGRSGLWWFIISIFLSPVIAALMLLILGRPDN
jgi:hypothetical protein